MFVSAFDLFRIGFGPSSAHTTGPMRAARRFVHMLEADGVFFQTRRISIDLYGSVACTGRDHGTDRALLAGFVRRCSACGRSASAGGACSRDPRRRPARAQWHVADSRSTRRPTSSSTSTRHSPTTATRCASPRGTGAARRSRRGSISRPVTARSSARARPRRRARRSASPILSPAPRSCSRTGRTTGRRSPTWRARTSSRSAAPAKCGRACCSSRRRCATRSSAASRPTACCRAARRPRRAATQAAAIAGTDPSLPAWAAVYATAVAEENAAGGRIVSAPSNGSAGPVAAVLHQWRSTEPLAGDDGSVTFLLAAAAVGQLLRVGDVKHAGCQGEVGVASAMAAAGLAAVNGASNRQVLHAAERALEPFVGMTCDPAGGLVQDPCIARNAAAAAHAVGAARFALRLPNPPIALDSADPYDDREGSRDDDALQGKLARRPRRQRRRLLDADSRVQRRRNRPGALRAACYARHELRRNRVMSSFPVPPSRMLPTLACACRHARRGGLRGQTEQGRTGGRAQHVRVPAPRRAARSALRRRRGPAADAGRRAHRPLPASERIRRPFLERHARAARQGHRPAAPRRRHRRAARRLPALRGVQAGLTTGRVTSAARRSRCIPRSAT